MDSSTRAAELSDGHPQQSGRGRAKSFVWHLVEMALPMQVGMAFFHLLFDGIFPPLGFVLERGTDLWRVGMGMAMIIGMVVWMRVRGHSWRICAEMAGAMLLPALAVFTLCWLGVDRSLQWLPRTADPAMYVGMLSAMLYRREHYVDAHSHGRLRFPGFIRGVKRASAKGIPAPTGPLAVAAPAEVEALAHAHGARDKHLRATISLVGIAAIGSILAWGVLTTTDRVSGDIQRVVAANSGIRVDLVTSPAHLMPGVRTTIQYRLSDAGTGAPVTDLVIDHTYIMHVLLISTDLSDFQHVHPIEIGAGVYEVAFVPSKDTHYVAYAAFRRGRNDLQDMRHLVGHSGRVLGASLTVDLSPKVAGGLRIALLPPTEIRAKQLAPFRIWVEQAGSGKRIRDLQPFLGAAGHVVIAPANIHHFMYIHAQPGVPRQGKMGKVPVPTLPFGPVLGFTVTFETPGLYRTWVQIQRKGQVITAPFAFEVK